MAKTSLLAEQPAGNLNFSTAQKMIHRLLTLDRIKTELDEGRVINHEVYDNKPMVKIRAFTKEELAEKLGISQEEFNKLNSPDFYESMANKISLSLIRLYCSTKFADGEYKGK